MLEQRPFLPTGCAAKYEMRKTCDVILRQGLRLLRLLLLRLRRGACPSRRSSCNATKPPVHTWFRPEKDSEGCWSIWSESLFSWNSSFQNALNWKWCSVGLGPVYIKRNICGGRYLWQDAGCESRGKSRWEWKTGGTLGSRKHKSGDRKPC